MKKKHISVILFCLYIGVVALLCFAKGDQLPQLPAQWFGLPADKIAHLLMFLPFTILALPAVNPSGNGFKGTLLIIVASFCVGVLAAVSTEVVQNILGYRKYEIADLIMDIAGLSAGTVICLIRTVATRRRNK